MMNLPSFPTDNLYKFISIEGIILFVTALFYPEYRRSEINNEIALNNGDVKRLSIENQKSSSKLKEIKDEIEILDEKANNTGSIVNDTLISRTRILSGKADLVELSKKIDKLVLEWKEINMTIELKRIDIDIKSELTENKREALRDLNDIMIFLGPLSMLLTFIGFVLWYDKAQKFQDKVLSEQTSKLLDDERCQSCGMLLMNQDNFNSFTDDEKKSIYCKSCYADGNFTEPNLTLEEMSKRVKNRCQELKLGKLPTYLFVKRLRLLQRWKDKFTW